MVPNDLATLHVENKSITSGSAIDVLTEIAVLCEQSVEARAHLRVFLDTHPIVAVLDIDRVATVATGQLVVNEKPSDGLTSCLEAVRAAHENGHCLG
jgi:hypothetical protein